MDTFIDLKYWTILLKLEVMNLVMQMWMFIMVKNVSTLSSPSRMHIEYEINSLLNI